MSKIDLAVLGVLRKEPMHGYEIAGFFEKRGLDIWLKMKKPSVYKALNRLEEKEMIWGEFQQSGNNPPKKVFTITDSGAEYFLKLLDETFMNDDRQDPKDFWNAMRFAKNNLTQARFIEIIEHRQFVMNNWIKNIEEKHKHCAKEMAENEPSFIMKIMMNQFSEIKAIEFSTLEKLIEDAMKPENQKFFI